MRNSSEKIEVTNQRSLVKICVYIAMALCSFVSTSFIMIKTGIDPSWQYAINLDVQWGSDIVLTYGPLGFLLWTVHVNHNLLISGIFWILLYGCFVWMLWQFFFSGKSPVTENIWLMIACAGLYCVAGTMVDAEKFYCLVAMFSLLMAYKMDRRYSFLGAILLMLSFYIKGSLAFQIISGYLLFVLMLWIGKKKDRVFYTIEFVISILLFPVSFFVFYCHSFEVLWKYIYGTIQMSTGYNVAMSGEWSNIYAVWIVLVILCYLSCCIIMAVKKSEDLPFAVALMGPLFFAYKHGFVRADIYHIVYSFPVFLLLTAPFLLACDMGFLHQQNVKKRVRDIFTACMSCALMVCFLIAEANSSGFIEILAERTVELPERIQKMLTQEDDMLYVLPEEVLNCIGNETVCIYPWEVSYAASNEINWVLLPAVQAYSAYTPYLDGLDAEFLEAENAPEYIILGAETIDNRWPMLECPRTWLAIRDFYELVLRNENIFVMKRKEAVEQKSFETVYTIPVDKKETISVSPTGKFVYKIKAELSLWGKIVSFFWKIPEVEMTAHYVNGSTVTKRVILDNLSGGADMSHIFADAGMLGEYLTGNNPDLSAVISIDFSGPGLKYYKDEITVETYRKL